jgi:hypothetical protein
MKEREKLEDVRVNGRMIKMALKNMNDVDWIRIRSGLL